MKRYLFFLFIVMSLNSCSYITFLYFRNYTDDPVEIMITTAGKGGERKIVRFYREILKIDHNTRDQLTDSLTTVRLDDSTCLLTVPANSTVSLTSLIAGRYDTAGTRIMLRQDGRTDSLFFTADLRVEDANREFQKTGGWQVKNIFYYDYGKK